MSKLQHIALATLLGLSIALAPTFPMAQAAPKITKPSPPTIISVTSSFTKQGKVNIAVTIKLPTSNGGSSITGSKVRVSGKSCSIEGPKTKCTIKGLVNTGDIVVEAASKNKKGFSVYSSYRYSIPAAPKPTSSKNCTPGYDPCLAPSSDYDCSGGSGNGPSYTGRVKVTGSDIYGLDRDGDGWGCD